jgi:putative two-component system response regulator
MKTIFVVDDSDTNLAKVEEALEERYRVMTMPSAAKMFALLEKITPDLILLDIEMPELNGFQALEQLKASESETLAEIPVMFLTGHADSAVEAHGFELGAVDLVTKPFSAPVLLNRIKTHLDIDEVIRERTSQLYQLQNALVAVLADMVENRDKATSGHVERTSQYIKILINEMKERGVYADEIHGWDTEKMISSARMHDLGKIAVTDIILNKSDKLTNEEYELIKVHAAEGERIIEEIISRTGEGDFLHNAKLFAGYHHERWDGKGYPHALNGTEIPLQGRIMAIVDTYDALISDKPYKKPHTHEEAMGIIKEGAGKQYDPQIVEIFLTAQDQIKDVMERLQQL